VITHWIGVALSALLPIVWMIAHYALGLHAPVPTLLLAGAGIFGAAFLLSWAAEVAQLDIPRALALAVLALVAVLPEYAVDVYFAWRAGQDPTYTAYATANMTGANRLLIGVGWAVPVFAYALRYRKSEVVLPRGEAVEVRYLALATLYSFLLPLKGDLALYDTAVLLVLYLAYARAASRTHGAEPELEGPAETIAHLGVTGRRIMVIALFLIAGVGIFSAAEPFAESLVATGREFGVDEFLLVQWLAPLASEAPEFIVAILFALRGAASSAMATMISSKVNQWTLLVGALPAAFAISSSAFAPMELDSRQREEIFLTSAQSLFALVVIADYKITVVEAALLFLLFLPQFFFTHPQARLIEAGVYLVLSAIWLLVRKRRGARDLVAGDGLNA
jgi:cation:H+ antiporter